MEVFDIGLFGPLSARRPFADKAKCQSALDWDPRSASKRAPFDRRVLLVALGSSELAGNTEPLEAIREHPVIALDLEFYLLADADQALTEPTGFYRNFRDYLVEGPIVS